MSACFSASRSCAQKVRNSGVPVSISMRPKGTRVPSPRTHARPRADHPRSRRRRHRPRVRGWWPAPLCSPPRAHATGRVAVLLDLQTGLRDEALEGGRGPRAPARCGRPGPRRCAPASSRRRRVGMRTPATRSTSRVSSAAATHTRTSHRPATGRRARAPARRRPRAPPSRPPDARRARWTGSRSSSGWSLGSPVPRTSRAIGAVGMPASVRHAAYAPIWRSAGTDSERASLASMTNQPSSVRSRKSLCPTKPPSKKVAWTTTSALSPRRVASVVSWAVVSPSRV